MPIFQGTAKNRFSSLSNSEDSGKLTKLLSSALLSASAQIGGPKKFADSFVEDGSFDVPGLQTNDSRYTNLKKPSRRAQLTQHPRATVLIKKKQFAALRGNYETRYLDDAEKLYLRCVKALMKRKCEEIAFYESLISFSSIYEGGGFLNIDNLTDSVMEGFLGLLIDTLGVSGIGDILSTLAADALQSIVALPAGARESLAGNLDFIGDLYRLKQKNELSKASAHTRWVEAPNTPDYTGLGPGTGTIELNLVSSIDTQTGLTASSGSSRLQIEDPYQLMLITDNDIEIAVRNTTATTNGLSGFFTPNAGAKLSLARALDARLNESRAQRKLESIIFTFADGDPVFEVEGVDAIPAQEVRTSAGVAQLAPIQAPYGLISEAEYGRFKQAGLSAEDIGIINQVLKLLRDYSADLLLSVDIFANSNVNTSELRRRMRRDFLGQHLVQPVDQVSVFINSHTEDMSTRGGGAVPIAGKLDIALSNEKNQISLDLIEQERKDIAPSIPLALYGAIRNRKLYRPDGNCVFTGLIESVADHYQASNGNFSLSVQCSPMTKYLQMGRFTFKPGLNNTFGLIHDPVTPFELKPDPVTGLVDGSNALQLIDQNKARMPYLSVYYGPNAGKKLTDESALISDKEESFVLNHTPGLVYRWKEGIISATPISPGPGILRGVSGTTIAGQFGGFSAISSPFAGMDAANIASVLVCGQPYDYTTFLQTVRSFGGFSTDATNGTRQFFNALFDSTNRMARFYGDFIPAKDSTLDRNSVVAAAEITKTIEGLNSQVQKLLAQRAQKETERLAVNNDAPDRAKLLTTQIEAIENAIRLYSSQISASIQAVPPGIDVSIEGNDVLFSDQREQATTDIQLAYRLRRKPEDVRLNLDNNYFIVSSKYDSSSIVQAFRANIASQKYDLFSAEYKTPLEIIESACSALSLEFFADNNGNLVLRPPQYNRIPLSLMMDLIRSRGDGGRSILPPFLANLAVDRTENLKGSLLDNELELAKTLYSLARRSIFIDGAAYEISPLVKADGDGRFSLDTDKVDRELQNIKNLESGSSRRTSTFGPAERLSFIEQTEKEISTPSDVFLLSAIIVAQRLRQGKPLTEELKADVEADAEEILLKLRGSSAPLTINTLVSKLGSLYSKRAALLRSLTSVLERYSEAAASPGASGLAAIATAFSPMLSANLLTGGGVIGLLNGGPATDFSGISPLLKDIVDDDINNVDGPGSAGRFIINDERIISVSMTHSPPRTNQVAVRGAQNFVGEDDGQIAGIPNIVAEATDFDSWRQYGLRSTTDIRRPDFTSADQQCAPYAVATLLRERQAIHTGTVTVIGNEWYRPGDNVYLAHRGMVYYVESVGHNLTLSNGNYTTTLELSFGRPLGEYVPTPTDLVGTVLLKNTAQANKYRTNRRPLSNNSTVIHLGTANFSNYEALRAATRENLASGGSSRTMSQLLSDVDSAVRSAVARCIAKFKISSGEGRIEIRGYYAGSADLAGGSSSEVSVTTRMTSENAARSIYQKFIEMASEIQNSSGWVGINTEATIKDSTSTAPQVAVSYKVYDISADLSDEDKKVLAIPSEDAWLNPVDIQLNGSLLSPGQLIQLPLNAIDIVYIVNKNRGNTKAAK